MGVTNSNKVLSTNRVDCDGSLRVTLALTAVFAYLTCSGGVTAEQFLTVFTVVIAFYFGTQAERAAGKSGGHF